MNSSSSSRNTVEKINSLNHNFTLVTSIILTVVGLPGNSITILILSRRKMRNVSMFRYLIVSMVNDSLVLVTMWFSTLPEIFKTDVTSCKLSLYLSNLFYNCSAWIVILSLTDRLITVKCPTKFKFRSQFKFQFIILFTIFMIMTIATIPFYVYYDIHTQFNLTNCMTRSPQTEFFVEFFGALVGVIIPFFLMIILSAAIGKQLIQRRKNIQNRKKFNKEIRLIKMMIIFSVFFLIFNLPYYIQQLIRDGLSFNDPNLFISNYIFNFIYNVTDKLCYVYNSFGFLVCLFSNNVFRKYFFSKFCFHKRKIHPFISATSINNWLFPIVS